MCLASYAPSDHALAITIASLRSQNPHSESVLGRDWRSGFLGGAAEIRTRALRSRRPRGSLVRQRTRGQRSAPRMAEPSAGRRGSGPSPPAESGLPPVARAPAHGRRHTAAAYEDSGEGRRRTEADVLRHEATFRTSGGFLYQNQRNRPPTHDVSNYRILRVLQAGAGEPEIILGTRGRCRYCGATDPATFRNVAHTFPEAFGNKWIKSVDECDACNTSFGSFDDALAKSLGAVLTVGGTQGKRNKVRQTGRTTGPASIRHSVEDGQRSISMRINGTPFEQHVGFIPRTMEIALTTPAGTERFVPALGYRALVKMALAMLPTEEMDRFANTVAWLREPVGNLLHDMTVGLSFGNVGNAPPILAAALLRRTLTCRSSRYRLCHHLGFGLPADTAHAGRAGGCACRETEHHMDECPERQRRRTTPDTVWDAGPSGLAPFRT